MRLYLEGQNNGANQNHEADGNAEGTAERNRPDHPALGQSSESDNEIMNKPVDIEEVLMKYQNSNITFLKHALFPLYSIQSGFLKHA